jgi:hypothetical protein
MIGFHWKRGNIESECNNIFAPIRAEAELQGIDAFRLKKVFERVMENGSVKAKNKGNIIYIYALIDPRNLEVRYIGKTIDPSNRMRAHIFPHNNVKDKNIKMIWTEELKSLGLNPIMQILCTCKPGESELYEYRYYKLFKESCDLLNSATILKETFQYDINF